MAKTNSWALAAIIGALTVSPLGIIFGHIALSQIKRTGEQGKGLATAGLIIGYFFTTIAVVFWVGILAAINSATGSY